MIMVVLLVLDLVVKLPTANNILEQPMEVVGMVNTKVLMVSRLAMEGKRSMPQMDLKEIILRSGLLTMLLKRLPELQPRQLLLPLQLQLVNKGPMRTTNNSIAMRTITGNPQHVSTMVHGRHPWEHPIRMARIQVALRLLRMRRLLPQRQRPPQLRLPLLPGIRGVVVFRISQRG
jgi:hypothetical protein